MNGFIANLVKDLKEASERPEIKGGNVDYLLKTAAFHLENQQTDIESYKTQIREMGWELDIARQNIDERRRYDEGY